MSNRVRTVLLLCALLALLAGGLVLHGVRPEAPAVAQCERTRRMPRIRPDYVGTVIPPNIAPLNFLVEEPGTQYCVRISSRQGEPIEILSKTPQIVIPEGPWKILLDLNRGEELQFDVLAKGADGQWRRFDAITNTVSTAPIDSHLVYRLLGTGYIDIADLGIYQRDVEGYAENLIFHNRSMGGGCINCHTFLNGGTSDMILHVRGDQCGFAMVMARDGDVIKVDTRTEHNPAPAAYSSWHPSGRVAAFSVNKIRQFYHTIGHTREVYDADSDVCLYLVDSATVTSTAALSDPGRRENWPAWSPDGEYLYFSSAPDLPRERFEDIKYDLMRISYDVETGQWGKLETVLSAGETGLSMNQPKVSPDGRFLLFCMSDYSSFPLDRANSDLYMMALGTRRYWRLEINSDSSEAWHCWSSNGRWIVFSSRRLDGVFTRPFFSYIDEDGNAHKPLLLPQRDPAFYDTFLQMYNVPELVKEPVRVSARELGRAISGPAVSVSPAAVTGATPRAKAKASPATASSPDAGEPPIPRQ